MPSTVNYIDQSLPLDQNGEVDNCRIEKIIKSKSETLPSESLSKPESILCEILADLLLCSLSDILSLVRKRFQVGMPIATIFQNSKVQDIRDFNHEAQALNSKLCKAEEQSTTPISGCTETHISTYPPLLILQLVPIFILYLMKQVLRWTSFLYIRANLTLLWPYKMSVIERYLNLLASMFLSKIIVHIISPLIGIAIKWVVIGRYEEGLHPMWVRIIPDGGLYRRA